MADLEQVELFEGAKVDETVTYKDGGVPQTIAGYAIYGRFLDEKGGTILGDQIDFTNNEDAGGNTGEFRFHITQAITDAFRVAYEAGTAELPSWFEMYVLTNLGAEPIKWMNIPCLYHLGGQTT